jgi:MFS family permease
MLTFQGLWRHPDFVKLWAGETISLVGSQITLLALPLTAVLTLGATPGQMGLLGAIQYAPFLLLGLFAGVWVDRLRRRPILIGANLGRAALLGLVPLLAALDLLRIEHLYVLAFPLGVLTVFFDVAYQSFLPALVRREDLVEGNSKLEASRSVAQVAGPGLAGMLVQFLTAPIALALDAVSFVVSAGCLMLIRVRESTPTSGASGRGVLAEIGEGLRLVLGNPLLRPIAGCTGSSNLFSAAIQAVFVLYLTRELGIAPTVLGLIVGAGGVGALLGATLAQPAARRFGVGPTIVWPITLGSGAWLVLPLAGEVPTATVPLLMVAYAILLGGGTIYNVSQVSLRQAITPDHLQGRMNATMRFIVWGTMPIGALLGGALGEAIGLRTTLIVAALGALLAPLWVLLSPVRTLHRPPLSSESST